VCVRVLAVERERGGVCDAAMLRKYSRVREFVYFNVWVKRKRERERGRERERDEKVGTTKKVFHPTFPFCLSGWKKVSKREGDRGGGEGERGR